MTEKAIENSKVTLHFFSRMFRFALALFCLAAAAQAKQRKFDPRLRMK